MDRFAARCRVLLPASGQVAETRLPAWLAFSGIDVPGGQEWDSLNTVKVRFHYGTAK